MSDRYTKIVLTVIACALVVIAGENVRWVKNAKAQSSLPTNVNITGVGGKSILYGDPLPVSSQQ